MHVDEAPVLGMSPANGCAPRTTALGLPFPSGLLPKHLVTTVVGLPALNESWSGSPRGLSVDARAGRRTALLYQAYQALLFGDVPAARSALEHALALDALLPLAAGSITLSRSSVARSEQHSAPKSAPNTSKQAATALRTPRIVIRTLGKFEVRVDGAIPDYGRKQPRRVLALLKAIVALGGRDVCAGRLADALWPDLDGDRAHDAFQVTLHRLRTRLNVPGAIVCQGGLVSLHPELIWVDALAFDAAARTAGAEDSSEGAERALELYAGEFLPDEHSTPWTVCMRERVRARFVQTVTSAAAALEDDDRFADALSLYRRAIDADDLACVFNDGVVRCLHRLGRGPEAESTRRPERYVLRRSQAENRLSTCPGPASSGR